MRGYKRERSALNVSCLIATCGKALNQGLGRTDDDVPPTKGPFGRQATVHQA